MGVVDWAIVAVLAFAALLAVSSIVSHHRLGELCDCKGDCESCTIRCMSNERYYGTAVREMAAMPEGLRRMRVVESRLSRTLRRTREVVDLVSYRIFNLCAIACAIKIVWVMLQRLLGL